MKSKILLVEDDVYLREGLVELLTNEGYETDAACTFTEGKRLFASGRYDLVILDVMLPDGSGLDLCGFIRDSGCDVPVLFLTACDEEFQIVRGLDAGRTITVSGSARFRFDKTWLKEAVGNVIKNACEHTSAENGMIDVTVEKSEKCVTVSVSDKKQRKEDDLRL